MQMIFFSSKGWRSWGLSDRPVISELMPVLVDDDLLFEDERGVRGTVAINTWLRWLPLDGVPAPNSWEFYGRTLREWCEFLATLGIGVFDERGRLKDALSLYAVDRSCGPLQRRLAATTWNQQMSILSRFYAWADKERHAPAMPFTYKEAVSMYGDQVRTQRVNQARRRTPKRHVTIRYFEADFAEMFVRGLAGLRPNGSPDTSYRGRTLTRNAAVGDLVLSSGLRSQEFTYLLDVEVPPLPPKPTALPISFPVPEGVTKGRKFRTTWTSYNSLARVHRYMTTARPLATVGSRWRPPARWGEPLMVSETDARGGRVNGTRVKWAALTPSERRRLVAPDGGSMLLGVQADGSPFTAWATVFERTSTRIRERFEPRFPHTAPHRLRHTFAIRTLEWLVSGHFMEAARMVHATDTDAALALYLGKADPMMVLRDLLGHTSVVTTEAYLRRLDMTRIYREAYERAGHEFDLFAEAEADEEFEDEAVLV
ncbi:site-specific integrase [Streptomyces sp. NPDC090445]|uniref:site-specific integrase n=1 Tax=Streptomyces sp. NPDC090445 TaxID=3365963 RepID=UPI00381B3B73